MLYLFRLVLAVASTGCNQTPPIAAAPDDVFTAAAHAPSDAELLARGEDLVRIAGCNDCHTAAYAERQGKSTRPNG